MDFKPDEKAAKSFRTLATESSDSFESQAEQNICRRFAVHGAVCAESCYWYSDYCPECRDQIEPVHYDVPCETCRDRARLDGMHEQKQHIASGNHCCVPFLRWPSFRRVRGKKKIRVQWVILIVLKHAWKKATSGETGFGSIFGSWRAVAFVPNKPYWQCEGCDLVLDLSVHFMLTW